MQDLHISIIHLRLFYLESHGQSGCRYGHNRQKWVAEFKLNHYKTQYWQYDPRLYRRCNLYLTITYENQHPGLTRVC